jgi:hypothetical protein
VSGVRCQGRETKMLKPEHCNLSFCDLLFWILSYSSTPGCYKLLTARCLLPTEKGQRQ